MTPPLEQLQGSPVGAGLLKMFIGVAALWACAVAVAQSYPWVDPRNPEFQRQERQSSDSVNRP